jgi:stearoyl-CoA desaturase (delta-9 desaturase)
MSLRISSEKPPLDRVNLAFIGGVHCAALLGLFYVNWNAFWLCVALYWLTGSLGIGLGFHRYLTHRSFAAPVWLCRLLVLFGALAVQGGPIAWVAGHRLHHAYSDGELDPHNSRRGFWWAHLGWIFYRDPKLGRFTNYSVYARDLANDPYLLFLDRWYILVQVALALLLLAIGGWPFVIWGIFVRLVICWHVTWLVNSAAHMFGYQTYESRDDSRNCWWVALVAFGEGWHNNHHAFPRSARHGLRWWEIDLNYAAIRLFEAIGLLRNVRRVDLKAAGGRRKALRFEAPVTGHTYSRGPVR